MSLPADHTGGSTALQRYYCHQCKGVLSIFTPIAADPVCPICGNSFVEELEFPEPHSNPNPPPIPSPLFSIQTGDFEPLFAQSSAIPSISSPGSVELRNPGEFAGLIGLNSTHFRSQPPDTPGFNPQLFVRDHLQSIFSGGASIQVVFEGAGAGGRPFAGNIGDYVFGSGLEHLIQQLFENDPNRYGPPPAAKSAVEALPVIKISEEMVSGGDGAQCAVCKDVFVAGDDATQIPCKHIYHKDCIVPWLELHNSCPVCRYELPTDDPDYVQRVRSVPAAPGGQPGGTGNFGGLPASAVGGEQRPSGRRTMHRRVRISLPWPFRGFGSLAEWSGSAGGVNDSSSSANRNENSEDRQTGDPQPRQDNFD